MDYGVCFVQMRTVYSNSVINKNMGFAFTFVVASRVMYIINLYAYVTLFSPLQEVADQKV